jgi:hypothetical protein
MYIFPERRTERQNPHSPDLHLEGGARFALSIATRTDSVDNAGISLKTFPILTFILKLFSAKLFGKYDHYTLKILI